MLAVTLLTLAVPLLELIAFNCTVITGVTIEPPKPKPVGTIVTLFISVCVEL